MNNQQLKNDKAALQFEAVMLISIILTILVISAWFRQDEYIIGMGIGVSYTLYAFFIYFRWERLK